jgi:hypothetical protein
MEWMYLKVYGLLELDGMSYEDKASLKSGQLLGLLRVIDEPRLKHFHVKVCA